VSRRVAGDERGAALVEFALLLPVLAALVLGVFSGGLAYNRKITITNAVREGARFGSTLPFDGDWATTVRQRVLDTSTGELTTDSQVCVKMLRTPSDTIQQTAGCPFPSVEPATPSGVPANTCIVKVWAQRSASLEVFFFSRTVNLSGRAVGLFERFDTCPQP
jgi:Flp pilus assembly protein TadG